MSSLVGLFAYHVALVAQIMNIFRKSIREALVSHFTWIAPLNPFLLDNSANGLQIELRMQASKNRHFLTNLFARVDSRESKFFALVNRRSTKCPCVVLSGGKQPPVHWRSAIQLSYWRKQHSLERSCFGGAATGERRDSQRARCCQRKAAANSAWLREACFCAWQRWV